jgi:sporulation protein YlmC with PRC-barrel domain
MKIEVGTEVLDSNGVILGVVNNVIRNSWTGEISKFMVRTEEPEEAHLFSPEQVLEVTDSKIKLSISLEELTENA